MYRSLKIAALGLLAWTASLAPAAATKCTDASGATVECVVPLVNGLPVSSGNPLPVTGGGGGGGGTSSNFNAAFPTAGTAAGAEYLASPPTLTTGKMVPFFVDANGNLKVNIVTGGGSGGTSAADNSAFTYGTTPMTPVGGVYNSSITNLTSGSAGAVAVTADRNMFVNVNRWVGTLLGAPSNYGTSPGAVAVLGANVFVTNTPSVNQGTSPWVDNITQWGGATLGAATAYGTAPTGNVLGGNVFVTNTPAVTQSGTWTVQPGNTANTTPWLVTGSGTAGTATGGVVTVQGVASMTPLLTNPGTAANIGVGATGSAVPANGVYAAADAQSAEPTKATTGNLTGTFLDLTGKVVTSPYANRENMVRGSASATGTGATTIIAAQGASVKTYITDVECGRSDAGTAAIIVTFSDSASTILVLPNSGGGGGNNKTFNVPLVTAANTAFTFTAGTGTTTVYCSAQGFSGY